MVMAGKDMITGIMKDIMKTVTAITVTMIVDIQGIMTADMIMAVTTGETGNSNI